MDASKNIRRKLYNISKKTGKGSIYIYYSNNGKEKKFPTGIKLDAAKWDNKLSKPRRGALTDLDNAVVDNLYNTLVSCITQYQFQYNQLPDIPYLESNLNKPKEENDIHRLFQEFIKARNNRLAGGTIEYYEYAAQALKEVDLHYKYNLTLNNFNFTFIEKFVDYQLAVKNNSNNTINQRIDVFKTFVKYLDKKDIEHTIRTDSWEKLDKEKTDLVCLEKDELNEVLEYKPKTPREQRTKDIIIFLSHTGIRQIDLFNIRQEHIINNCIEFYPQKTKRQNIKVIIPISQPVREILERYKYVPPTYTPKYLSKYIQQFCANIPLLKRKIVYKGELVEKHSILTSHSVGRKTFINLCVQAAIPLPTIMGFTGHSVMDTLIKSYLDKHINNLPQLSKVFHF